jgi:hypothetical protein
MQVIINHNLQHLYGVQKLIALWSQEIVVDSFTSSRRGTRETNVKSSLLNILRIVGYHLHSGARVCLCVCV